MRTVMAIIVMAVMVVAAAVFTYRMRHATRMCRAAFVLYLVGQILAALYLFYLVIFYDLGSVLFGLCVLMGLLCVPVDFALHYVLTVAEKQREAKERVRLLEEQQRALDRQRERLDEEAEKAQQVRDEIIAELNRVLDSLDAQKGEQGISLDFGKTLELVDSTGRWVCQHHMVGALLASKQERAQQEGIRVEFSLNVPEGLPFSDAELCAVFSNLFDNAVNACMKIPEGADRFVKMKAYLRDSFFVVDMRNSCLNVEQRREQRERHHGVLSEHGWGISIIRTVAERHGGLMETSCEDGVFSTMVVLGLGTQGKGA